MPIDYTNDTFTEEELREIDGEPNDEDEEDYDDGNEQDDDAQTSKKRSKKTKSDAQKAFEKQCKDIVTRCDELLNKEKQRVAEPHIEKIEAEPEICTEKATIRTTLPKIALREVEDILSETGIDLSDAIRLYVGQIILQHGIPFDGFRSNLRPKAISEARKDRKREQIAETMKREYAITKNRRDIKYWGGTPPAI